MKNQTKRSGSRHPLRVAGLILLCVSLLFFVWLMGGAVAYGWISHGAHYGAAFTAFGKWYFVLAGGMTIAVLLTVLGLDLPAIILGLCSYLPMLGILLRAMQLAEQHSWSGQTEASFGKQASEVWRNGQMGNAAVLLLLLVLALTHFFSYEVSARRQTRRRAKEQAQNAAAPSILDPSDQPSPPMK